MKYQAVFERYEIKYMITMEQKESVLKAISPYMQIDEYGRTTIRNIYYDTDDYILARHSIVKPDFKEKLRIRSYSKANKDSRVFVELKRKYDGIVYKRRIALPEYDAMKWMAGDRSPEIESECKAASSQVTNEIEYFYNYYPGLKPMLYLSYEREAYKMKDGSDFRVTFDDNIKSRDYDISLESEAYGTELIDKGMVLMELKCSGGLPLWMTEILSKEHIYKTSFSKYGTAYRTQIYPEIIANKTEENKNERVIEQHLRKPADSDKHKYRGIRAFIRGSISAGHHNSSGVYV